METFPAADLYKGGSCQDVFSRGGEKGKHSPFLIVQTRNENWGRASGGGEGGNGQATKRKGLVWLTPHSVFPSRDNKANTYVALGNKISLCKISV